MITFNKGFNNDSKTRLVTGISGAIYPLDGVDLERTQRVELIIDPDASKNDVKKAVERIVVKGRRGKRGAGYALKELGALRLFRKLGKFEAALDYAMEHAKESIMVPQYDGESQWWRAKANALKRIEQVMQNLF
jgi:hypothetical protein